MWNKYEDQTFKLQEFLSSRSSWWKISEPFVFFQWDELGLPSLLGGVGSPGNVFTGLGKPRVVSGGLVYLSDLIITGEQLTVSGEKNLNMCYFFFFHILHKSLKLMVPGKNWAYMGANVEFHPIAEWSVPSLQIWPGSPEFME